ncbi:MAG: hypothetical protein ACLFWG_07730, partial [Longimicrobiales bacterium]
MSKENNRTIKEKGTEEKIKDIDEKFKTFENNTRLIHQGQIQELDIPSPYDEDDPYHPSVLY